MLPRTYSLEGFLFDRNAPAGADLSSAYRWLFAAVLASLAVAALAAWQMRVNRLLRREARSAKTPSASCAKRTNGCRKALRAYARCRENSKRWRFAIR
jgi:hypothetical protein